MHIGITEIIVIILVAIIVIKPGNINEYAESLGTAVKTFSEAKSKAKDIEKELKEEKEIES